MGGFNGMDKYPENIIFFDGVCNLCNRTVDFVIKKNEKQNLYFTSLQSPFGRQFLNDFDIPLNDLNTLYYYHDDLLYNKSTAVLKILKELKGLYPFLSALLIIPIFIREFFYDLMARHRYRIFGKRDSCRVPTEEEKPFFIDRLGD